MPPDSRPPVTVPSGPLRRFRRRFTGSVVLPGDPDYHRSRTVWNGMIDRRPALIARCATPAEVAQALAFGREQGLLIAVRGGGHSVAGFSTCDSGIVIDLGHMRGVTVDSERRVAVVGGGALLSELDLAAQQFGLACPVGVVGHTGLGGLTLGGGVGRLQRKLGYTIDNLRAVDLITAEGRPLRVDKDHNADLFWALRGAGANFGVVSSFEFDLHPIGPDIVHGFLMYPIDRAAEVTEHFRRMAQTAPWEVAASLAFGMATSAPPFRPEFAGQPVVHLEITHCGTPAEAAVYCDRLVQATAPLHSTLRTRRYLDVQLASDVARSWGHRFYMKNCFLNEVPEPVVSVCIDRISAAHGDCEIAFMLQGGAINRVAEAETAFAGRAAMHWCTIETLWDDPAEDPWYVGWARSTMAELQPYTVAGSYVNDVAESGAGLTQSIYGDEKYQRLLALKQLWDPDNVFRMNQNIRP
jgi:FAD/FMN-containing dehydrogenase